MASKPKFYYIVYDDMIWCDIYINIYIYIITINIENVKKKTQDKPEKPIR